MSCYKTLQLSFALINILDKLPEIVYTEFNEGGNMIKDIIEVIKILFWELTAKPVPVPVRPAKAPPKVKDPYAERLYTSAKYLEDM